MKRLSIIIPLTVALILVFTIGFSVIFAQGNAKDESNVSKLAVKVADILGLDSAVVDGAIKEAARELRLNAAQKKLSALVDNGVLTQDQADEKLNLIQSRASQSPSNRELLRGAAQKKLSALVDNGVLTQDQADEKLNLIQSRASQSPSMERSFFRPKGHQRYWKHIGPLSKMDKQRKTP